MLFILCDIVNNVMEYMHLNGKIETVKLVQEHPESKSFTIFIPSLGRERQTIAPRLRQQTKLRL